MPKKTIKDVQQNPELQHALPHLMSITEFAAHKLVQKPAVYDALTRGKIIPIVVGAGRDIYIDSEAYKDYAFKQYPKGKYPRPKLAEHE